VHVSKINNFTLEPQDKQIEKNIFHLTKSIKILCHFGHFGLVNLENHF